MSEKNTDKELSMDELKAASGGGMGLDRLGSNKFSQGQTAFSELSGIERNFKGKNKKDDSLLDGQPEHGTW